MRYWITTHWPPRVGDPRPVAGGVYLPHDRGEVGAELRAGDLVLVYESLKGRTQVRRNADGTETRVPCAAGRGGVVAIGRAREAVHAREDDSAERYTDGTTVDWRWFAALEPVSQSGFLPREALNVLLGYRPNNPLRGFGDRNSGLKRLDQATFERIETAFVAGRPPTPAVRLEPRAGGPGGEGAPHRRLKEYVAGAPAAALREPGLSLVRMEHPFPTGDRADVVLADRFGRLLGVEVEVHVGDGDPEGFLQALKYAAMLPAAYARAAGDSRAVLVAYTVSAGMRARCARYGVECVDVVEDVVRQWHEGRRPGA